jgi:hypothetical protein
METDIGNPIDFEPDIQMNNKESDPVPEHENNNNEDPFYFHQPQMMMQQPQYQHAFPNNGNDFFANLDKTAYAIIFVAFILGFFMGKTMQPVILRPG